MNLEWPEPIKDTGRKALRPGGGQPQKETIGIVRNVELELINLLGLLRPKYVLFNQI